MLREQLPRLCCRTWLDNRNKFDGNKRNMANGLIIICLTDCVLILLYIFNRNLLKDSMNVTVDDIKHVVKTYLVKFFDPKQSCCSLLTSDAEEKTRLVKRLEEMGYKMECQDLGELCSNL